MTGENEGLEPRVSALESETAELRDRLTHAEDDAVAGRVLAAGADHDVAEVRAELRAHRTALNALAHTQSETLRDLREFKTEMREFQGEARDGFAYVASEMSGIKAELTLVKAGIEGIATVLARIAPEG